MVSDDPAHASEALKPAASLALALDVIEARLEALPLGAGPDAIAAALAGPVRALDGAAKAAFSAEEPF